VKEVQTLLQASNDNYSLNAELDDESHTELADVVEQTMMPSAELEMQTQSRREELLLHMSELSPKERLVLTLRHGVSDNIPKSIRELASFLNREEENVRTILASANEKVCGKLGVNESELAVLLLHTNPNDKAASTFWQELDDRSAGTSRTLADDRLPYLQKLRQQASVQQAVDELSLEEKTIIKLRYGILQDDELTLRDIGEILNLSRERVRQIESRAEAKCRRSVRRER
jgi:DNA-directed RNA polymerase sigma subunit (sigma70/sigma32)